MPPYSIPAKNRGEGVGTADVRSDGDRRIRAVTATAAIVFFLKVWRRLVLAGSVELGHDRNQVSTAFGSAVDSADTVIYESLGRVGNASWFSSAEPARPESAAAFDMSGAARRPVSANSSADPCP